MKVLAGERVFSGDSIYADNCLAIAREKFKKENVNALYALEKDDTLHMMKEVFSTCGELLSRITEYEEFGFKCHYITKDAHLKKGGSQ